MKGLFKTKENAIGRVVSIPIADICPNESQPRKEFSSDALLSLSESIRQNGILQPVTVRRKGVLYEIISGERRTRAAKLAGLNEIPCIILSVDDEQSAILALIENIQRKDLSFFEEAVAIEKLISRYGLTQEQAAARLGKAQSTIANKLRLLRFSDAERSLLIKGDLSERHARALIRIDDPKVRLSVLEKIVRERLNIDQTESLIDNTLHIEQKPGECHCSKTKFYNYPLPSKLYMNSLNKLLKQIKEDKVDCEFTTEQTDRYYEYSIRFPITS